MPYKDPVKARECARRNYSKHNSRNRQPDRRARVLWNGAVGRARRAGLPCTITKEWVETKLAAGHCEATGFPFTLTTGEAWCPYAPSIDRIDSARGYTPDNCRLTISAFNLGKNRWSDDVLAGWARAFLKHYHSRD